MNERTEILIRIALRFLELHSGEGVHPLRQPRYLQNAHIPDTWITSLATFIHDIKGEVETTDPILIPRQREHDQHIMRIAIDGNFNTVLIHQCKMWYKVSTLADIATSDGAKLESFSYTD